MNAPTFSVDWFSQNIGPLTEVLAKFKGLPNLNALEIGCFEGRGTLWLLENVLTHPTSIIGCIDTFQGSAEHEYFEMSFAGVQERFKANTSAYSDNVLCKAGKSLDHLRVLEKAYFDIVYVDGSHMALDVLTDLVLSWPLLKKGGVMFCDDYEWPGTDNIEQHRPQLAIDAFKTIFIEQLKILHMGYSVAFEKL